MCGGCCRSLHNGQDDFTPKIIGRNPPRIHFVATTDVGRMVAQSYGDDRALGKRLFVHGPEPVTLHDALQAVLETCYPDVNVMQLRLWQARLIARLTGRMDAVSKLIRFFDRVGELGDPTETNTLFGAPATTLEAWIASQK
jgi:hypothetical protein